MNRFALAVPRCLVLALLAVTGFAYSLLVFIDPCPLARLGRRLARTWGGADLPDMSRRPPPEPHRRADGWYVHGSTLYRSRRIPAWLDRLDRPGADRELRWLFLAPFSSALPVLVPSALVVTAVVTRSAIWLAPAVLVAPFALPLYGRWTRNLLDDRTPPRWVGRASAATWRLAGLAGLSLAAPADGGGRLLPGRPQPVPDPRRSRHHAALRMGGR
jgi:hypothetical protein